MELQLVSQVVQRAAAAPGRMITTRSGRVVRLREGTPDDLPLLDELAAQLSPETRQRRWFVPISPEGVARLWRLMFQSCPAQTLVVAELPGARAELIAAAQLAYNQMQPGCAEVAMVVRDDYQRDGIGSGVARLIGQIAQARGLRQLTATALAQNSGVAQLLRSLNVSSRSIRRGGETEIEISLR